MPSSRLKITFAFGWGCEDHDLVCRALGAGYTLTPLHEYGYALEHPEDTRNELTRDRLPRDASAQLNGRFSELSRKEGTLVVNTGRLPGEAVVIRNFRDEVEAGWRPAGFFSNG